MKQTIVCEYCETKNPLSNSHCLSCNAVLRGGPSPQSKAGLDSFSTAVMKLCEPYEASEWCNIQETAAPKKLARATETFGIPADEQILVLYDDTLFGSNKNGFAICREGLYWRNSWDTPTKRTSLSWEKFVERPIKLEGSSVDFGRGDQISVTASSSEDQQQIVAFFRKLQELLRDL